MNKIKSLLKLMLLFLICAGFYSVYFAVEILTKKHPPMPAAETPRPYELTEAIERPENARPQGVSTASGGTSSRDHRYVTAPFLAFRNYKNFHGRQTLIEDQRTIFDKALNTDDLGRRCLESTCAPQPTDCGQIAVYASSRIFGYGVDDAESLPAQIKKHFPKLAVYNYGVLSGGYKHLLLQLKSGELKKTLSQKPTLFLYFWEHDRFQRTVPSVGLPYVMQISCLTENPQTQRLDYAGNYITCHPFKSFLIWNLSLTHFFKTRFPNLGLDFESDSMNELLREQKEIEYEIQNQFPGSRYVIGAIRYNEDEHHLKDLTAFTERTGIESLGIDFTEKAKALKDAGQQVDFMPYDAHPAPAVLRAVANDLAPALKLKLQQLSIPPQCFEK